ncbi:L,D-transpeptidase family protein [Phenylobacterium sp.]|uniref:L,D-transpeptidase family protein n=1 Tax=Phenylobacterium sp. TaxID=1871053 RepID=UPI0025EF1705|nr:L,D-transpeptidase family protein [Phenylobacterium sp.]
MSLALLGCNAKPPPDRSATLEAPPWDAGLTRQLSEAIDKRRAHGLDRLAFDAPKAGQDDAALTKTALAYASALARGASDPHKLFEIYTLPRPDPDLQRELAQAMSERKVGAWLEALAPQDENYRKLSQAYLALGEGAPAAGPDIARTSTSIRPGQSDVRIPAVAAQLVALDYLEARQAGGLAYSGPMVAAVRRMQGDYGIEADGVLGGRTLEALSLTDEQRAAQIAANMERLRWLEREPPATRIDVNIAAARLTYWQDGAAIDSRRVIVGEPDTATPQLASPIKRLVANPSWTVPRSIERKELASKGEDYLRRNNMAWKDGWIVQSSGPANSLGLVKFDMANEHAIYLHDTPAKQLFGEVQRQRSHGCVRVEDALGFAEIIAAQEGVGDAWRRARSEGREQNVALPNPIPVRLLYQTVLFNEGGQAIVRADPYDWNTRVARALGFGQGEALLAKSRGPEPGP